jgi:hypothetical protein
MPTTYADAVLISGLSNLCELPLDAEIGFDDAECAHIMRQIGIVEGEPGTTVSAFNSSI